MVQNEVQLQLETEFTEVPQVCFCGNDAVDSVVDNREPAI